MRYGGKSCLWIPAGHAGEEACVSNLAPLLYLELSIKVFFSAILKEEHVKMEKRRKVIHICLPKPEINMYVNSGPGFKPGLLLG